ncbi:hypothetical protein [Sinomicrobium sp. M5D2P9]
MDALELITIPEKGEDRRCLFKDHITSKSLAKDIIAFSNTQGNLIIIVETTFPSNYPIIVQIMFN